MNKHIDFQEWSPSDYPGSVSTLLNPVFPQERGNAERRARRMAQSCRDGKYSLGLIRLLLVALSSQNGPNNTQYQSE
jgi:hypothetical protein